MSHYLDTAKFSVDWLNVVLHTNDVAALFGFFGTVSEEMSFDNWTDSGYGTRGYRKTWLFQGQNIIRVSYNPKNENIWVADDEHPSNPNILVSISGDGCRYLSSHGFLSEFFAFSKRVGCHSTRLDVCCDLIDSSSLVLIDNITEAFRSAIIRKVDSFGVSSNTWIRSKNVSIIENPDEFRNQFTYNTTFGNHDSQFGMFRCYDKWLEVKTGRLSSCSDELFSAMNVTDFWYRLEYETHKEHADFYFQLLINGFSVQEVFRNVASDFFRVVKAPTTTCTFNRCSTSDVWDDFLISLKDHTFIQEIPDNLCAVPYIRRSDLLSLRRNVERTAGYIYGVMLLVENDPELKLNIETLGREKFFRPNKSELRRSFEEYGISVS